MAALAAFALTLAFLIQNIEEMRAGGPPVPAPGNAAIARRKPDLNHRFHQPIRPRWKLRSHLNILHWYRLLKTKAIRK